MSYQAALHPRLMAPPRRTAASLHARPDTRHAMAARVLVWTLIVLMIVPEGFDYTIVAKAQAEAAGPLAASPLTRMLWLGLLGASAALVFTRLGLLMHLLRSFNPFFLAFLALATASVAWSLDPTLTIRRLIRLFTMVMVALAFALLAWNRTRYQDLVRPILTLILGGSILFGLALPQFGVHQEASSELAGAWRGLANHKNTLGALSAIGVIFWFHAWLAREVRGLAALAGLAIAFTTLLLSRSSTSLVTAVFVMGFMYLMLRMPGGLRAYQKWIVGFFVLALLVYTLVVLNVMPGKSILMAPIMAITGKDYALTGRHDIWQIMLEHIRYHPVLGAGFGAFWAGPVATSPSYDFVLRMWFYPGSGHNGYLDMLNDLGTVGLLVLVGYLLTHVRHCLGLMHADRAQGVLLLAIFFQQAVSNLSETHWLNVMNADFVLVTLASAALARARLEQRMQAFYAPYAPPAEVQAEVEPEPAPPPAPTPEALRDRSGHEI